MRFAIVLLIALAAWSFPARADDSGDSQLCTGANSASSINACTRIIERGGSSISDLSAAYNNRGLAYSEGGDNDSAIADLDQAPRNAAAYDNRGAAYLKKGDYDRAIADLDQALSLDPQLVVAHDNRSYAYQNKGEYERAISDYDEAIKAPIRRRGPLQ